MFIYDVCRTIFIFVMQRLFLLALLLKIRTSAVSDMPFSHKPKSQSNQHLSMSYDTSPDPPTKELPTDVKELVPTPIEKYDNASASSNDGNLKVNEIKLKLLNAGDNQLGASGAEVLSLCVGKIENLWLCNACISPRGMVKLCASMEKLETPKSEFSYIDCLSNDFPTYGLENYNGGIKPHASIYPLGIKCNFDADKVFNSKTATNHHNLWKKRENKLHKKQVELKSGKSINFLTPVFTEAALKSLVLMPTNIMLCLMQGWCLEMVKFDFVEVFIDTLATITKDAHDMLLLDDRSITFFASLHLVNNLSLSDFDKLKGISWKRYRRVFGHLCIMLKQRNWRHLKKLKKDPIDFTFYETKLEIFEEYLDQQCKVTNSKKSLKLLQKWRDELLEEYTSISLKKSNETKPFKFVKKSEIVADGTIYDRERDPPGQRSVYIAPGDQYHESYRLSTFIKFPVEVPVNPRHLANSGFFYTGYKDRVKCFSCGLCVENWALGDDVRSPRWHRSDCAHAHEGESGNVPIGGGGLARFLIPTTAQTAPSFSNTPITAGHPSRTQTTPATRSNPLLQSSYQRHQTARPPPQSASIYQIVEFATIASAYHEHFLKSIDLRKESERIRTFEHFPTDAPTVTSHDLARSGFFYLGNLDRVQCFSCGGVLRNWNYGDSVQSEHRRHFPTCNLVQNNEPRNVPLTSDERAAIPQQTPTFTEPPDPPQAEQQDLRAMFPCEYPVSAHMRNEDSRLQTFDERWSANNVQATPQQISRAGFFYLGERDRVKCWYCNGGLQNWDPQDEPWTEHAKWFPTCEFLLQRKGPDFVHRMVSMFPNLPRPLLRGPFDVPPAQGGRRIQFGSESARAPTPPPQIIDPQEDIRREQERVNTAMQLDIVKAALELGFPDRLVRKVVKRRIHRTEMYRTTEDLVSDLTAESEVNDSDSEASAPASPAGPSTSNEPMDAEQSGDTESMQHRIRELQEERKCKICLDRLADIVFVPCGHLCCCDNCATSVKKCPMCRKKIEKAIRTYMS